jgi:hypothetical protein
LGSTHSAGTPFRTLTFDQFICPALGGFARHDNERQFRDNSSMMALTEGNSVHGEAGVDRFHVAQVLDHRRRAHSTVTAIYNLVAY